jgi:hypothetical protein
MYWKLIKSTSETASENFRKLIATQFHCCANTGLTASSFILETHVGVYYERLIYNLQGQNSSINACLSTGYRGGGDLSPDFTPHRRGCSPIKIDRTESPWNLKIFTNSLRTNPVRRAWRPHRIENTHKHPRVYPKVSGPAAWSENCKWYSSLPLGAVVSLFCESG